MRSGPRHVIRVRLRNSRRHKVSGIADMKRCRDGSRVDGCYVDRGSVAAGMVRTVAGQFRQQWDLKQTSKLDGNSDNCPAQQSSQWNRERSIYGKYQSADHILLHFRPTRAMAVWTIADFSNNPSQYGPVVIFTVPECLSPREVLHPRLVHARQGNAMRALHENQM